MAIEELFRDFLRVAECKLERIHRTKLFQDGKKVYPGDTWCQPQQAHAKWHAQSAVGLLDLIYLADEINRLTK